MIKCECWICYLKECWQDISDFILWENFTMTIIIPIVIYVLSGFNGWAYLIALSIGISMSSVR